MVTAKKEPALILVKAFPQPSQKYEETVCCAGLTAEGNFVRLYPIRYRHLSPEKRFERWDLLEYEAAHPTDDWRPESRHVNEDTIRIIQSKAHTDDEQRVRLWASHISDSLSALKEENKATEKSLGIIRPDPGSIKFKARKLSPASEDDTQLQAAFKQVSLIELNALVELSVEFDFSYRFTSAGHPHEMKIHDWEVQAAYFAYKRRYAGSALDMLRQEYEERIPQRNLHFVMGTMKAHPRQFIIIGLLRSPISPDVALQQGSLL